MPSYKFKEYIKLFKRVIFNTLHKIENKKLEENVVIRRQHNMDYIILELLKEDEIKELSEYLKDEKNLKDIIEKYYEKFYQQKKVTEYWSLVISGFYYPKESKNKYIGLIVYRTETIPRSLKTEILGDFRDLFEGIPDEQLYHKINSSLVDIKGNIEKFLDNNNEYNENQYHNNKNDILNQLTKSLRPSPFEKPITEIIDNMIKNKNYIYNKKLDLKKYKSLKHYENIKKFLEKLIYSNSNNNNNIFEQLSWPEKTKIEEKIEEILKNINLIINDLEKKTKDKETINLIQTGISNIPQNNLNNTQVSKRQTYANIVRGIKQTEKKKNTSVPTSKSGANIKNANKILKPIKQKTYANIVRKGLKKTENGKTKSVPTSNSGAYLKEAKKKLNPIEQKTYANVLKKSIKQTEKKKNTSDPTSKSSTYLKNAREKLKPIEQKKKNNSVQTPNSSAYLVEAKQKLKKRTYKNVLTEVPKNK
jgi:hypothetical protein